MIKLTELNGNAVLVNPNELTKVVKKEAGERWFGDTIERDLSLVFGGVISILVKETVDEIFEMIKESK